MPKAARRPPLNGSGLHRSKSALTLSDCYFGAQPLLLHTVESVVFERRTTLRPVVPPPELEELAECEGAVRDLLVGKLAAKLATATDTDTTEPRTTPTLAATKAAALEDPSLAQVHEDLQNVAKLFSDALDIAR